MANEMLLVDLNSVIEQLENEWGYEGIREDLYKLPTVDAVEVVRCKKCKHCKLCYPEKQIGQEPTPGWYCKVHKSYRREYDFCSYGERREGE